jgi:hypothetical protein
VATNNQAVKILKPILDSNRCEIGTHLHPWNTPPIEEVVNEQNTMLNNLNRELQYKKLQNLHQKIIDNFHLTPKSFRAGRYAIDVNMAKNLIEFDYKVESSITPFFNWSASYGPDFSNFSRISPYKFSPNNILNTNGSGKLLEVPLTVGFRQSNFNLANAVYQKLNKIPFKYFRLQGVLYHLHLLNRIRLSPEGYTLSEMCSLVRNLIKKNIKILNITFHSNSLLPGCTPFVSSEKERDNFLQKMLNLIDYLIRSGFKSITLSEINSTT